MSSDVTVRSVRFLTAFPWLRLGQAWGCALSLQQLALACAAVLALTLVDAVLRPDASPRMIGVDVNWRESGLTGITPLAGPVSDIVQPTRAFLTGAPGWWRHGLAAAIAFVVWSVAGLALSRCTAIQFGRDENPFLRDAVQFSLERTGAVCGAPLIPLGFAAALCVIVALLALPGWIPALGYLWLIVLGPVLFVLSAAAAFVVVVVPVLWPLMVAAVSVDDGDSFDAFSRSFSLVASRFWSTLALMVLCALHALVALWLLTTLHDATVMSASWSADWTLGQQAVSTVAKQVDWWSAIVVRGVIASLFWTLATMVYLFLRESVDGVPLSRIAGFDVPVRRHEPYPVVGIPAVTPPSGEPGA